MTARHRQSYGGGAQAPHERGDALVSTPGKHLHRRHRGLSNVARPVHPRAVAVVEYKAGKSSRRSSGAATTLMTVAGKNHARWLTFDPAGKCTDRAHQASSEVGKAVAKRRNGSPPRCKATLYRPPSGPMAAFNKKDGIVVATRRTTSSQDSGADLRRARHHRSLRQSRRRWPDG